MNFIIKLPISKDPVTNVSYNSIWVIVDRFNNKPHYIHFKKDYNARTLYHIWMDRIVRIHAHPEEVISDRDKLFTSEYWKIMMEAFGTKLKHSNAYHLQTDGQTEGMNQTLKQYLRHYVNQNTDNWVELLPNAEYCLNNRHKGSQGRILS